MEVIIIAVLLILNIPIYKLIFGAVFRDVDDFKESLRYMFTPDLISFFRGEYWKDRFAEMKAGVFFFLCIAIIIVEFIIVQHLIEIITW